MSEKRYELRKRGVFDRETGEVVTPEHPAWSDYTAWLLGNAPDPIPPVPAASLDERRKRMVILVNAARDRALERLVVNFEGRNFQADQRTQTELLGEISGAGLPGLVEWITADNVRMAMGHEQALRLMSAIAAARRGLYFRARELKDARVMNSDSPEDVDIEAELTSA